MTTVFLHRSHDDFLDMSLRQIVGLIDNWKKIENNRSLVHAYLMNGGDPEKLDETPVDTRDLQYQMGEVMW